VKQKICPYKVALIKFTIETISPLYCLPFWFEKTTKLVKQYWFVTKCVTKIGNMDRCYTMTWHVPSYYLLQINYPSLGKGKLQIYNSKVKLKQHTFEIFNY